MRMDDQSRKSADQKNTNGFIQNVIKTGVGEDVASAHSCSATPAMLSYTFANRNTVSKWQLGKTFRTKFRNLEFDS